ncbi:MAG: sugar-binding domain-containing protein [Candidatus Acidiferrales bacterium]
MLRSLLRWPRKCAAHSLARAVAALLFASLALPSLALAEPPASSSAADTSGARQALESGWRLQSSCDVKAPGEKISAVGFSTEGWHATTVPAAVVAALVTDKTYPDPDFGMNLRSIPGTDYPIGKNFSLIDMPKDSPFRCSWWYRTEFAAPAHSRGRHVWLHFGGINYRANIWVNGHRIADDKEVAGAYRTYEFDIAPYLAQGKANVLAVETFAQTPKDLGINWVDWNPAPPDKDMGLWRKVFLDTSGPVAIRHPLVVTRFPDANSLAVAELTVETQLRNATQSEVSGTLSGSIEDIQFSQPVTLKPGETRTVVFTPAQAAGLRVSNPKLWWPYQMGPQNLHNLSLSFTTGGAVSDTASLRFGMREITGALDPLGHMQFRVNGVKILIRGGGWSPDMLLRESQERLETEFRYVRDMNLNTIRLEGKMESDAFYDLADEKGVLVMAGWCCCDIWEQWQKWKPRDLEIATESLRSQSLRMRSHPSLLVWLNGSDNPPPANVEKAYIGVLKETDWPNPYLSSASQEPTTVTGPSGVKMTGPYDYVPPDYWLTDTSKFGGAYGFNSETSPGPAIPLQDCLRKFLPAENIRTDDPVWNYHAGSEGFKNLDHFDGAMNAIYGAPANFGDYELKSQAMAYDGERAMFEAYSRNKYAASTGVIQWMLNNAWPSLIWHLYDYYLEPAGGYFGTKKACEPLHVQYSYDDRSVVIVNSLYRAFTALTVSAHLYDAHLHELFSRQVKGEVASDGVARTMEIPATAFAAGSPIYFVDLSLQDGEGKTVSTNFYWLSAKKNVYDWPKTDYKYTPVSSYEDLTALQSLPKAAVTAEAVVAADSSGPAVRVKLHNTSEHLAFQLRLGVSGASSKAQIVPVFWSDNYIELMPGETRELVAHFAPGIALPAGAELTLDGWNVASAALPLAPAASDALESPARQNENGGH